MSNIFDKNSFLDILLNLLLNCILYENIYIKQLITQCYILGSGSDVTGKLMMMLILSNNSSSNRIYKPAIKKLQLEYEKTYRGISTWYNEIKETCPQFILEGIRKGFK